MPTQKTRPTEVSVEGFLDRIDTEARRADASRLVGLLHRITGEKPRMWGDSIVGFGQYHYEYASGHQGDSCLVGFSPRKSEFSIYLTGIYFPESADMAAGLLARLGKHRMGKACLYVKRLTDIDEKVLADLVALSVSHLRNHYKPGRQAPG